MKSAWWSNPEPIRNTFLCLAFTYPPNEDWTSRQYQSAKCMAPAYLLQTISFLAYGVHGLLNSSLPEGRGAR